MTRTPNLVAAALAAALVQLAPAPALAGDGGDFVTHMTQMQYFTHKLGLAVDTGNRKLQGYYVHEVEEIIEKVEKVKEYKGIEVGKLIGTVLEPSFEKLEDAVESGDAQATDAAYDGLIDACNRCHTAANHDFLVVERRRDNPFIQNFSPAP